VTLVLSTRNPHKVREFAALLDGLGVTGLPDDVELPPETGETFAENALIKARALVAATGLPAVADDSGLAVDVLGGAPGIFSARWAGRHGDDRANLELLLAQLADVPDERRGAAFVCAAALVVPDGAEQVVERQWRGRVVREKRGSNGFGYDPVFVPEGLEVTSAELAPEEKDARSHRGQAFAALVPLVAEALRSS
jgi:XTP/dITP diphosphohydrolase